MPGLPATIVSSVQKLTSMTMSVVSPETKLAAQEYLASIRKELKAFKAAVVEVKKPFKKEIDAIDTASKPWIAKLQEKDEETERTILAYNRKVQAEIEAANRKKIEKFEAKVEKVEAKAVEQGKPLPFVAPPQLLSDVKKTEVVGDMKQTTVKRKTWWLKGVQQPLDKFGLFCGDPSEQFKKFTARENNLRVKFDGGPELIPDEYFILDTAKVGAAIRAGLTVPGIDLVEVEGLSGRAV